MACVRRPETAVFSPLFLVVAALFVTSLVVSNIIAVKLVEIAGHVFPAGLVLFPLSYVIADILTEVYGYGATRAVIWLAFACNLVAVAAIQAAIALPAAGFWADRQPAYAELLGFSLRLLAASFAAYLVGEFANAVVLARMKIRTKGRWLWSRTIGSTVVGQGLDSAIFVTLAFAGTGAPLLNPILTVWAIKVAYEVAATPLTYAVVGYAKRREGVDAYDVGTSFNPFALGRLRP
jgi:queuosine precursor transporter